MKQIWRWLAVLICVTGSLEAYEDGQLSLDTPTLLEQGDGTFTIRHRFYGEVDDVDNFFGMDSGANIMLQLRYVLWKHLFVKAEHTRLGSENVLGVGTAYDLNALALQAKVEWFSFKPGTSTKRKENIFANAALKSPRFFDHLQLTANVGYNGYYKQTGLGLGADLAFANFIPALTFTETIALLAEYYPVVDEIEGVTGKRDSYAFGVRFRTYAHHFELLLTNADALSPRSMMLGTDNSSLHFGFNINRKF